MADEGPGLRLVIKNPSAASPGDFSLGPVAASWSVLQLKEHLRKVYPGSPDAARQKLIVAGQLARDSAFLADLFKGVRGSPEERQAGGHEAAGACSLSGPLPPVRQTSWPPGCPVLFLS